MSFVQLCCLLQSLDPVVFACLALLKDCQGAGRHKAELCWSKACAAFSSSQGTKGEDEDGESQSDQQTGKVTLVQWDGSEKSSCKFKGPEDDVKSAKTGF